MNPEALIDSALEAAAVAATEWREGARRRRDGLSAPGNGETAVPHISNTARATTLTAVQINFLSHVESLHPAGHD